MVAEQLRMTSQALVALAMLLACANVFALDLRADRNSVPLNETLRLEVRSSAGGTLSEINLGAIEEHFDVIGSSSQSEFSMVNGRTESLQRLSLTLKPRATGRFTIAPLEYRGKKSAPLTIRVTEPVRPPAQAADETVILESELSKTKVMPGEQVIYTLRLLYRVRLSDPELGQLAVPGAEIVELEDANFQRQLGSTTYQVVEKRYALFFAQPGQVEIASPQLSAVIGARRSRFGFGLGLDPQSGGQRVRLAADPVILQVNELPANADAARWLPAQELELRETWSPSSDGIEVGQPITRSIEIYAVGLAGERLPELTQEEVDGLNRYPEKPAFVSEPWSGGVAGKRVDTYALIPTRPGAFELPGLSLQWWNTERNRFETATLPARRFTVTGSAAQQAKPETADSVASNNTAQAAATAIGEQSEEKSQGAATNVPATAQRGWFWPLIATIAVLGWLLTAFALWRLHTRTRQPGDARSNVDQTASMAELRRALLSSCRDNDARQARRALDAWAIAAAAHYQCTPSGTHSSARCLAALGSQSLLQASEELDRALFANDGGHWSGEQLEQAVKTFKPPARAKQSPLPPLYPVATTSGAAATAQVAKR